MPCHLNETAGGGANGVRFKGACNARLTRATRNGDERGSEVNAGGMCGAPGVLPWPRQAGGVAVWGPEGGEGGEASAGEGPRGAGRPWGGGMVTGGDADAQRQLTMAGGAMGWEAAGREGGGAGAYLQSIVTNVAQRPVKDVGRRLEPAGTR